MLYICEGCKKEFNHEPMMAKIRKDGIEAKHKIPLGYGKNFGFCSEECMDNFYNAIEEFAVNFLQQEKESKHQS